MRSPLLVACLGVALGVAACDRNSGGSAATRLPPLQAGVAEVRMPVPLGIGTVGYFGATVSAEPSPFARRYPATTRLHGHPTFRAIALSRGPEHEVIFLRGDLIGVFQQFRRAVVLAAEARLGRPIDDALIFGATHTHAGPGRILDGGGIFDLIADVFLPEFYENMVDAAATAIVEAVTDLKPARVGHTWGYCVRGHSDRRCEDGLDYTNGALPIVAVEREGVVEALLVAYAVHSTGLGIRDLTLSRDVAGAIEAHIESRFARRVPTLFFNSWSADMSPGNPEIPLQPGATVPGSYERMNRVGWVLADAVHEALPGLVWEEDPEVFAAVHRVPLDREALGYVEGEFPYPFGGVFCGGGAGGDCDVATVEVDLDKRCLAFPPNFPVPPQTELSAGRIGDLAFITLPGEPGTLLAEELLRRLQGRFAYDNVMVLGYSQDYTGYSILEDDWWQGGYEAGGALWGPRQGEYLVGRAVDVFERTVVRRAGADPAAPVALPPFPPRAYEPYVAALGEEVGAVVADVAPTYGVDAIVALTVLGSDPWLGAPIAVLIDADGDPVVGPGGREIDSDGFGFWVDLVPEPGYRAAPNAASRQFAWTFSLPVAQRVPGLVPDLRGGRFRIRVTLPSAGGAVIVESSEFAVL